MTDGLTELSALVDRLCDAEDFVVRCEEELSEAKSSVKDLRERVIPKTMDVMGVKELTTNSGMKIKITTRYHAGKLTQAHGDALEWLRKNGQAGLIKTVVGIPFAAGSESDADSLVEELAGEGFAAVKAVEVHQSSLGGAVAEMLSQGVDVPLKLLRAYESRVAKVDRR